MSEKDILFIKYGYSIAIFFLFAFDLAIKRELVRGITTLARAAESADRVPDMGALGF